MALHRQGGGERAARRAWRRGRAIAGLLAIAVATIALWPARWGGPATAVLVSGDSMRPTLRSGDLVFARPHAAYRVGEIVVYRLPPAVSSSRVHVVHRIVEVRDDGHLLLQGDNRSVPDGFAISPSDVVGSVRLRAPAAGFALWALSRWWVLAVLVGLIVAASRWPDRAPRSPTVDVGIGTT